MVKLNINERFWSKVNKTDTCWIWTASTKPAGYGQFNINNKPAYAHRVAWELTQGAIPADKVIDHRCHNRLCVNPGHLRIVSQRQNVENHSGPLRSNKSAGVRGVSWHEMSKKYEGRIQRDGKIVWRERFQTIAEAEAAVIAKRNELHTHNDRDRVA